MQSSVQYLTIFSNLVPYMVFFKLYREKYINTYYYPFSRPLSVDKVLMSTYRSPWSSSISANLGQAFSSCSRTHKALWTSEFSYNEFSKSPNMGTTDRFLNGEMLSMSSRSRLGKKKYIK